MPRTKTKPCEFCGRRHRTLSRRQCLLGKHKQRGLLWRTLKEAMRLRDGHVCQRCGKQGLSGEDEEMSHVYRGARCARLKYCLDNVKTMCSSCHRWWHDYEMESGPWFREKFPIRANTLDAKLAEYRADPGSVSIRWYELQLKGLREYIAYEEGQRAVVVIEEKGL